MRQLVLRRALLSGLVAAFCCGNADPAVPGPLRQPGTSGAGGPELPARSGWHAAPAKIVCGCMMPMSQEDIGMPSAWLAG